ncbi:synaptonemal complex central element protein 2 isoform X1 [Lingula anatina]|uniref:Synaptonemal complex central element protein 2 isoform X1 n=1 Tax=Lingula anatina TaxID=7574 RepID=A0A1S3JIB3_LINAN|nr:synaptonemal complex central element protein 2 isoform X1 [Lingula anatina]|eukprot:XP_013409639.1 synaptonemal complex central element protein 2 isoform X1 [Lingula anatina]
MNTAKNRALSILAREADTAESSQMSQSVHPESASQPQVSPAEQVMNKRRHTETHIQTQFSSHESLNSAAEQLINDINMKRKENTQMIIEFKDSLDVQVQHTCREVEKRMFDVYEEQGKILQVKLQNLFIILDRISKLEMELKQFRRALGMLYQEVVTD